ncbi:MAG TPA: DEAD/DEAH box helicase [Planctomycetota bacterium]|nr:DEAD/DEAH box helicase [Planctomycetota bacterium]
MDFTHFGLRPELLGAVKELGFLHPTPIQQEAIPAAMLGKDVLACAATGSGKTAAFALPVLHRLAARPRGGTRVLILTPTRELAAQVAEHVSELAVHTPLTAAAIYGGVGMGPQEHALRSGVDVIAATPGRLLDHFRFPYAKLDKLETLILDEADRMLDMGFLPDIRRILKRLPTRRQTLFFSATMPKPILELAHEMLKAPVSVDLQRRALPAATIAQAAYPVPGHRKSALLLALLANPDVRNAIVFTRTKQRANRLAEFLEDSGVSCARIHGNRSQAQREKALEGFKAGRIRVLVATDIAQRGIDVEALSHVVNYDVPMVPEDYVHRVGRTGRAEATGTAITFVSPEEERDFRDIEKATGKAVPRVTLPDFDYRATGTDMKPKRSAAAGREAAPSTPRDERVRRGDKGPARGEDRTRGREERPPRARDAFGFGVGPTGDGRGRENHGRRPSAGGAAAARAGDRRTPHGGPPRGGPAGRRGPGPIDRRDGPRRGDGGGPSTFGGDRRGGRPGDGRPSTGRGPAPGGPGSSRPGGGRGRFGGGGGGGSRFRGRR